MARGILRYVQTGIFGYVENRAIGEGRAFI